VEVTFSQPRVVISGETGRGDGASLHTRLERFEFSKSLGTSGDVKSLVDGDDLLFFGLLVYYCMASTAVAAVTIASCLLDRSTSSDCTSALSGSGLVALVVITLLSRGSLISRLVRWSVGLSSVGLFLVGYSRCWLVRRLVGWFVRWLEDLLLWLVGLSWWLLIRLLLIRGFVRWLLVGLMLRLLVG